MIAYLQQRRKFLVIVLGITVFAFVGAGFVGWGSYSYGSKSGAIANVGDEKITFLQYQQAYSGLHNMYSQFYENGLDPAMENQLKQAALDGLINEALFINFAKDLGLRVSNEEVQAKIISMDAFKKDGVFNKEIYMETIRNTRNEIKDFERDLADQLLIEKLMSFIKLPVTDGEKEAIGASMFIQDRLSIQIIDAPKKITLSSGEAEKHYEANKQSYMGEAKYDASYIKIDLMGYEADEAEAEEYYSKNRGEFLSDEGNLLSFAEAKELAIKGAKMNKARKDALKQKIAWRDGKSEAKEAKAIAFTNNTLPVEVMSALESSQSKGISDPIAVEDGYIIARVDNRYAPEPKTFIEAKSQVEAELTARKSAEILDSVAQKELASFKGRDIGFVARGEFDKLGGLSEHEAEEALDHIFASSEKSGIVNLGSKALLYKIVEQKLFDEAKAKEADGMLNENVTRAKLMQIQQGLINSLRGRYKVTVY